MGLKQPALLADLGLDAPHFLAARIGVQHQHPGPLAQFKAVLAQGPIDAKQFGIAGGILRRLTDAQRQPVGVQPLALKGRPQFHLKRLHRLGAKGLAVFAMDSVQRLRLVVPGFQICVAQAPIRSGSLLHRHAAEFLGQHPLQHPAPDLGVAPQGLHHLGGKGIAIGADPFLRRVIALAPEQVDVGHVLVRKRQPRPLLQQQHLAARRRQRPGHGAATGPTANDQYIKIPLVDHHGAGGYRCIAGVGHRRCQT